MPQTTNLLVIVMIAQVLSFVFLEGLSSEELNQLMPDNPFFGAVPRFEVLASAADHTAHHRGALGVYLRLLGIAPTMVYSE